MASGQVTSLVASGLSSPVGVAVDSQGNVYFSDTGHNSIREWAVANKQVATLVSSGLSSPRGVAVDAQDNVYFADSKNNAIKEWSGTGKPVSTLVSAGLNAPAGVAVDGDGNVYIADTGNNAIKQWNPASQQVTALVSTGLKAPGGVAVDGQGNVYIADSSDSAIKKFSAIYLSLGTTSRNEGPQAGTDSIPVQVLPAEHASDGLQERSLAYSHGHGRWSNRLLVHGEHLSKQPHRPDHAFGRGADDNAKWRYSGEHHKDRRGWRKHSRGPSFRYRTTGTSQGCFGQ